MRTLLLVTLLAAALAAPAALAANGQPQKKLTAAGQAHAKRTSLTLGDLGAGWKATRSSNNDQSNPRCSNYNPDQSDLTEIGDYDSPDFERSDGTFVSSSTGVFKSVAQAKTAYGRVAKPQIASCFAELLQKQIGTKGKFRVTATGPLSFPHLGERSSAYGIRATYTQGSTTVPFAVDLVLVNKGSTDVALIFFGVGGPLPAAFERKLASVVAARA